MSVKKYCYCENNCKYETLDKEEILAAIAQALATGKIGECDTGFITTIKTINGKPLKFFLGDQSEYEELTDEQKENLYAIITNDTFKEDLQKIINELSTAATEQALFKAGILSGDVIAKNAEHASDAVTLYGGTPITSGDLNDYTTEGNYYISNNSISATIANLPNCTGYPRAGTLKVLAGIGEKNTTNKYLVQEFTDVYGHKFSRSYESYNNVGWSKWLRCAYKEELEDGAITVKKAEQDGNGKNIADTYAPKDNPIFKNHIYFRSSDTNTKCGGALARVYSEDDTVCGMKLVSSSDYTEDNPENAGIKLFHSETLPNEKRIRMFLTSINDSGERITSWYNFYGDHYFPIATESAKGGVLSGGDITVTPSGKVTVNNAIKAKNAENATNAKNATTADMLNRTVIVKTTDENGNIDITLDGNSLYLITCDIRMTANAFTAQVTLLLFVGDITEELYRYHSTNATYTGSDSSTTISCVYGGGTGAISGEPIKERLSFSAFCANKTVTITKLANITDAI